MDAAVSLFRVIIVHRDPRRGEELAAMLREEGAETVAFSEPAAALARARKGAEVVVLSAEAAGAHTLGMFRQDEVAGKTPLLVVADQPLPEGKVAELLAAGVSDFIQPPFPRALLRARVANLARARREEAALAETEARYQRLFASSHTGYFLTSPEGRFLEVNGALVQMLGYRDRDEVLRLRIPQDLYARPRDRDVFRRLIERQGFVKDFKVDFRRKDGTPVTVLITAGAYHTPDGRTAYEGFDIPMEEVPAGGWGLFWSRVLRPFRRLIPSRSPRLSISRASELVADRYEKVEELSESLYSSVWKGRDILRFEAEPLVIKVARSETVNQRFLLEARTLRTLAGHPGVPELVDVGRHRGRTVLVTRFVPGRPLSEAMDGLSPRDKDRVAFQLADTVAHLHDHGIVHRDLKPENLVLRPDGTLVLLDFGIARALGEVETSATVVGTWPYMSPEQIQGKSERRTDVWQAGVVLFRLYTGRLPFEGATEIDLMNNILEREPPTARSLNPALSGALELILMRALRKRPEGRYRTAAELRDDLVSRVPGFAGNVSDLVRVEQTFPPLVP